VRWFLAAPRPNQDDPWGPTALWNADPRVVGFLSGSTDLAPALVSPGHWVADVAPCFEPSGATALRDALDRADRRGNRTEAVPRALVQLAGARGTGRKTWAAAICAKRDLRLLCIDAVKAFGERRPDESGPEAARPRSDLVVVAEREALLQRCALYWDRVDEASGPFRTALPMRAPLQFFGVRKPVAFAPEMPFVDVIPFSLPTPAEACRLWKHCLPRAGARSDPRDLAERFTLTPAEIVKLAEVAEGDPHRLEKASRALSRGRLAGLANLLPCPYEWDDLVVPEQTAGRLREILSQVRYRSTVYDDWGFGAKRPLGRGITALFAGRSGTGKTMAAQVLAREIGVVLYRIDIASVVSKYIGETEKNLKRIFDEAERLNAVLFFDEADALFGKRTEVRDAHDRYANIEVNYLLQRLESYEGLGVLATNRKGDLDSAFIRRVRFTIDFPLPKARERERIWRKALLETTPDGRPLLDGIQWRLLAQRLEISGAVIKDIALRAAFAACSEGTRIGMSHILDAARGELGKMGRMVDLILPQEQR
jgi:AAA+ superfamily predicted ATPase